LRLDEDFVKAATRSEPAARNRAPTRPVASRPPRRSSAAHQKRWIRSHQWVLYAGVIVAAVVGVAAALHLGPFARGAGARGNAVKHPQNRNAAAPSSKTSSAPSSKTATTTRELAHRSYSPGDCVKWDQTASHGPQTSTVVPCAQPHLIELASQATVPARVTHFPTAAGWVDVGRAMCAQPDAAFLGRPLDPSGRFGVGWLHPTPEGWAQGDRTIWCGFELTAAGPDLLPFRGEVRGQSQELLFAVGSCLTVSAQGQANPAPVPCAQPHSFEITGYANLGSLPQFPQSPAALTDAVQSQCAADAVGYAGRSLPAGVEWGYLDLTQASWNAGDRLAQCTLDAVDGSGSPMVSTGSLRG
jgi:hypothetical protein